MLHIIQIQSHLASIFNFGAFISALALLGVIYTITDVRFRFRIAIAPIPLHKITYYTIGIIGAMLLILALCQVESWPLSKHINISIIPILQAILGAIFLLLVLTWIYYAVIFPPIFNNRNYKKFTVEFDSRFLTGLENELPVLVNELERSANSIITFININQHTHKKDINKEAPTIGDYAYDILLFIGNRKLCRYVIASSPITAMAFFSAIAKQQKYKIPIGQFARNITIESLINKDSMLYHEDEGYNSGLLGYLKPFSQTVYGDYTMVEELAKHHGSPLDISNEFRSSLDLTQIEAYCRCVLITFKNYVHMGMWPQHSYALYSAFGNIHELLEKLYFFNDPSIDIDKASRRVHVIVNFVINTINILKEKNDSLDDKLRSYKQTKKSERLFYDYIAELMLEIIFSSAAVISSPDNCWGIQYCTVWYRFCDTGSDNEVRVVKIIHHKLRRLIYNEIVRLEKYPNYRSSKIFGFCLNVMGINLASKKDIHKMEYPLKKTVLKWTKNNYLELRKKNLDVAESCLIGDISFDIYNKRLVKTFVTGLKHKTYKSEYFDLS